MKHKQYYDNKNIYNETLNSITTTKTYIMNIKQYYNNQNIYNEALNSITTKKTYIMKH